MSNVDASLPSLANLSTDQIQQYLEENKQLILAIMEGQNLGKSSDIAQFQAKLQHNLTFLAKLADTQQPQAQTHSQVVVQQGQGPQHQYAAMSQPQDPSTLPLDVKDQQQRHLTMSLQQPDLSTSKLPVMMIDQQQQQYKQQPPFFQQQQLVQGQINRFPAATNSGINQASQSRTGVNLSGKQENNQIGLDAASLGKSPLGRNSGNTRP